MILGKDYALSGQATSCEVSADKPLNRWPFAVGIVVVVLMAAAGLKTADLMSRPAELSGLWGSRELGVALVLGEICLCAWLISGLFYRWAWRGLIVVLGMFTAYNFYQALMGKSSCGCFGQVSVNPWITMVLDIVLLAIVIACHPRASVEQSGKRFFRVRLGITGILLSVGIVVSFGLAMMGEPKQSVSESAHVIPGVEVYGSLTIIDPTQWNGKMIALNEVMVMPENWTTGAWRMVFFRHDCSSCQKEVPELLAMASANTKERFLFVEVPPLAPVGMGLIPAGASVKTTTLDPKKEWFVQTPVEVTLVDSVVTGVRIHEGH